MNHRTTSHAVVLCLIATVHAQSYPYPSDAEMSGAKAGEVVLKAGTLKGYAADFGMLVVPENRQKKDSRLIRLPVLRMGCRRERALEPVFTLLSSTPSVKFLPEALRTLAFFRWRCLDLTARYGR